MGVSDWKQRPSKGLPRCHFYSLSQPGLCFHLCFSSAEKTLHILLPVPRPKPPPPSLWLTSTAWISPSSWHFPPSVMQTQLAPLFPCLFHTPRKPLCALLLLVFPYSIIILYFLGRLPHLLVTHLKATVVHPCILRTLSTTQGILETSACWVGLKRTGTAQCCLGGKWEFLPCRKQKDQL